MQALENEIKWNGWFTPDNALKSKHVLCFSLCKRTFISTSVWHIPLCLALQVIDNYMELTVELTLIHTQLHVYLYEASGGLWILSCPSLLLSFPLLLILSLFLSISHPFFISFRLLLPSFHFSLPSFLHLSFAPSFPRETQEVHSSASWALCGCWLGWPILGSPVPRARPPMVTPGCLHLSPGSETP